MWPHSPFSPRKLQNPELCCSSEKLRKSQNLLQDRRPHRPSASSNLPGSYAELKPHHHCSARALRTSPRHKTQTVPTSCVQELGWGLVFFVWVFFLFYQDLDEIGCDLSEWVMFVQRFVNAGCYVSAQGYSRGLAGPASPPCACARGAACLLAGSVSGVTSTRIPLCPWELRYCPSSLSRCTGCACMCVSRCSGACAGAVTQKCEGLRPWGGVCRGAASRTLAQHSPHAPLRASSSSVYPPLAPDKALLSPLPRTPALAPVTQLLKVAGWRPGLCPSCLFLLLIVLIIARREHHVPSIRGQDGARCLF